jgi:hypothetical protein
MWGNAMIKLGNGFVALNFASAWLASLGVIMCDTDLPHSYIIRFVGMMCAALGIFSGTFILLTLKSHGHSQD